MIVFVKYVSVVFSGNHFHENSGFKLFGSASSNGISNGEHNIWQPAVKRLFVDRVQNTQIITNIIILYIANLSNSVQGISLQAYYIYL